MPFPQTGTERARPDLADALYEFDVVANMNAMVSFQVFPIREVTEFKGTFPRVEAKQLLKRHPNTQVALPGYAFQRAPRAAYAQDESSFIEDSYETKEFGLEGPVDDNEARAYRSYFEFETFVTQRINNQLMTETEVRTAAAVFDTTTFTTGAGLATNVAGTASEQWHNSTTATPIKHVKAAKLAMFAKSGIMPDAIVMNRHAWIHLITTDEIKELIKASGAGEPDRQGLITRQQVAQCFDLRTVIVAGGTYDSANPNAAFSPAEIWGPHAMVFKQAVTRDLSEVALGRTFHWSMDDSMPAGYVESYREPNIRGDKIRVRNQMQNKLLYPEVGHLLQSVYA